MTRGGERRVLRALWIVYGILAVAGFALLAEALFAPRTPRPFALKLPSAEESNQLVLLPASGDGLETRRFTRRVAAAAAPVGPAKAQEVPLDRLIKLTGILDFGSKQPTLAVIESPGESRAYKAGEKVGETGILIKDVKEFVIVEFEKRRFKVTFTEIQELPANAVGKD